MKTQFEKEDIQAIAEAVIEMLRPLVKHNVKAKADGTVFDVQGLAHYLKVDESWIYKQVSLKAIPYFKCGKYTRFKRSAIDRWVEGETVRPIPSLKMVNKGR